MMGAILFYGGIATIGAGVGFVIGFFVGDNFGTREAEQRWSDALKRGREKHQLKECERG